MPDSIPFERLTRLAARALHVPIAAVSLVEGDRLILQGSVGIDPRAAKRADIPLAQSLARLPITSGAPVTLDDARDHPDARDTVPVRELGVVAYAGVPLVATGGAVVGSFCIGDCAPRHWSADDVAILRDMAAAAVTEIELRNAARIAREAEESLAREREFLAAVLENLTEGVVACDAAGHLTLFNRATREFHGLPAEPIPPEQWAEHYDLYREDGVTPLGMTEIPLYRALQGEDVTNQEFVIARRDAAPRVLVTNGRRFCDRDGAVLGAVVAMHDVTDRKRARAELVAAKEEAEAANRAKSHFLSRMSHELRTPLNSVIGFAQVMLKNRAGNLRPEDLTYLERIRANGQHLLRLVNDILDLAKIEAGRMTLELSPVSLYDLVHEAVVAVEGRVLERDVVVVQDVSPDLRPITTDSGKLCQVLINLLGNAVKFTEHGTVTIRVVADGSGYPLRIEVEDTGPGIPPERVPTIFDVFNTSGAVRPGGTAAESSGLGLSIARALCNLLGFDLTVRSTVGEGSVFAVELDRRRRG